MGLETSVTLRIEKAGRKGKTVTLIERLPKAEHGLETLARKMKIRLGTGGTFGWNRFGGVIEIQGEHRESIRKILHEEGIPCKG